MIKDTFGRLTSAVKKPPRIVTLIGAAVVVVLVLAVAVGLFASSRPGFLGSYDSYEGNSRALESSVHRELACNACHQDGRGAIVRRAALVGEFYRGLVNKPEEPAFVSLDTPSNDACLTCHNEDWSDEASRTIQIPHPAHLRVAAEERECVECHKWTAHDEEYIERHKTMPFSGVCASFGCHAGWKSTEECGTCHHAVQEEGAEWTRDHKWTVQATGPNACLETCHDADQCRQCHTTGERPDFPEIGPDSGLRAIEREHVKPDWMDEHGGFAVDDDSKCFDCHVSPAECEDCHSERPDFHGLKTTWLNRHQEIAESEEDDPRCLACHEQQYCQDCHDEFRETR